MAGGLADNAGSRLKLTRLIDQEPIPLPNTVKDSTGQFATVEINLRSLLEARNPEENIYIQPHDIISVPVADTVYVIGHVLKAGPYVFDEHEKMTALQAVSMAGGMDNLARPKNARILRRVPGQQERTEIAVNLDQILEGKKADVLLAPEDILLIPNNAPKSAMLRVLDAAIQMGTGVVIWNRY
jgi:polysaccharide export outer membrane protein